VGTSALATLRALRLLRVFRILKLGRYLGASNHLTNAIKASKPKIIVFLFAVLISATIFGAVMYLVEGEENGFTNIPKSVYWCIVTLTTVGFGDIAPQTPLGQFIASILMILGYGIIAVPTGIVSAEYTRATNDKEKISDQDIDQKIQPKKEISTNTQSCANCMAEQHLDDAKYCRKCGYYLHL